MLNKKTLLRLVGPVAVALGLAAPAAADNVRFPKAAVEAVDAGAGESVDSAGDSLSGGKGGGVNLASPAIPEVKDPVDDPGGFYADLRAAWRTSWPLALVIALVGVAIAARKRIAKLRVPGTRLAAGVAGVVATGTAFIAWRAGAANLSDVLTALAMSIVFVLSPHTPEPPTVIEKKS